MRFKLTLASLRPLQRVTFNCQYPLAAAIYKIIQRADESYAAFLHEQGYRHGGKTFKFFTFSDLQTPFNVESGRLVMTTNTAHVIVCFHIPDAAENFIKGLFMNQQLDIAYRQDKASFIVQQVLAEKIPHWRDESVVLQPISPVVRYDTFYNTLFNYSDV
jgi:CRISPR-associated endoribonuclease Cas6